MRETSVSIVISIAVLIINSCSFSNIGATDQSPTTTASLSSATPAQLPISSPKAPETPTPDRPTQSWRIVNPQEQGLDVEILSKMFSVIEEENISLHSVVVVRNGDIVAEKYYGIWSPDNKHTVQSVTKTIISALVGIALEDGCIKSLDDPIWNYLPDRTPVDNDALKQEISLKHLLTMSSGFEWYDGQTPIWTSADWIQFVLDQPMAAQPGTVWNYNSGNAHLLSAIIQNACEMNTLDYARKKLFTPLGMTDVKWETDPKGIPNGGWGLSMLPRDIAKFGLLYLNDGVWDGQQIVPVEWIEVSTQKYFQVPKPLEPWDLYYGYTWWLHGDGSYYAAHGRGGQFIYILPEQHMVVVFTSDVNTPEDEFIRPEQLIREYIVPAVK